MAVSNFFRGTCSLKDNTLYLLLCLILYTVVLKIKCLFSLVNFIFLTSNQGLVYNEVEMSYIIFYCG